MSTKPNTIWEYEDFMRRKGELLRMSNLPLGVHSQVTIVGLVYLDRSILAIVAKNNVKNLAIQTGKNT